MIQLRMITVADQPHGLAGQRLNTIRKYDVKYVGLRPGDQIEMSHIRSLDDTQPMLVELLEVRAMAIGSLNEVIEAHGAGNHMIEQFDFNNDVLMDYVASFYSDGGDDHGGDYVAIYFD